MPVTWATIAGWEMKHEPLIPVRGHDIGELASVSPNQGVIGPIDETSGSAGDSAYEHIEMVLRRGDVIGAAHNQGGRFDLIEPGTTVEGEQAFKRAAHGRRAIGGHLRI